MIKILNYIVIYITVYLIVFQNQENFKAQVNLFISINIINLDNLFAFVCHHYIIKIIFM